MIKTAVCEDEAPARAYLVSLIRAQPCSCQIVEYASAADCLADRRELDLIFLDIQLNAPGLDGIALAGQLRAQAAACDRLCHRL